MGNLLKSLMLCGVCLFLAMACGQDEESTRSIEGSYFRLHTVSGFPVRLTFFDDGTFSFAPIGETDLHTPSHGRYTFDKGVLIIFDDDDCPGTDGTYSVNIGCDTIEITLREDACTPRGAAMAGRWTKE